MAITKAEILEGCDIAIAGYTTLLNEALSEGDISVEADRFKCMTNIMQINRVTQLKAWAEANL